MAEWFERSFGNDYLIVYKHRDMAGALREVRRMIDWLELPRNATILDLCCGMGRHALALSDFGYRVTGLDLSDVLLAQARELDKAGRVHWVKGDMRHIPLSDKFDAVVNLFTSFGYFVEDGDNVQVMREIARMLRPDGNFIIDYLNLDYVTRNLVPHSEKTDGNLRIEENRRIEDGFVKKEIVIREAGSEERRYLERVKLYGADDMRRMAEMAGLAVEQIYGNYDGNDYVRETSPRMIVVGGKEG